MKYAVIENNTVVNIAEADAAFAESQGWIAASAAVAIGWSYDGSAFHPPSSSVAPEQIKREVIEATQARLDAFASTRGYDDIKSASTYAGCAVPKFDVEGTYCRDARAQTWAELYKLLDEVEAGTRPLPNGFAEIEPLLPELIWPN